METLCIPKIVNGTNQLTQNKPGGLGAFAHFFWFVTQFWRGCTGMQAAQTAAQNYCIYIHWPQHATCWRNGTTYIQEEGFMQTITSDTCEHIFRHCKSFFPPTLCTKGVNAKSAGDIHALTSCDATYQTIM